MFAGGESPAKTGPTVPRAIFPRNCKFGVVIEGDDGVDAGYCYTAIHFTKDAVLLAYCAGGEADKNRLARLRIRKLPLAAFK